jgi:hypothetical protein
MPHKTNRVALAWKGRGNPVSNEFFLVNKRFLAGRFVPTRFLDTLDF